MWYVHVVDFPPTRGTPDLALTPMKMFHNIFAQMITTDESHPKTNPISKPHPDLRPRPVP